MIHFAVYISITLLIAGFFFWKCANRKSKEKTYRDLIDHINVGCYKYRTRDGVILSANKGFINIFELDMGIKEVIGRSISEFMIYVDGKESIRKQLKERGKLTDHEYHFKTLKGKDKYILHNSHLSYDLFSREEIVVGLIEDITDEKAAYNKMKESQEKYERLFKSSGDMVLVFDPRAKSASTEDVTNLVLTFISFFIVLSIAIFRVANAWAFNTVRIIPDT